MRSRKASRPATDRAVREPRAGFSAGQLRDRKAYTTSLPSVHRVEITRFAKSGGPLTKVIKLAADGSIKSDGSACMMSSGTAERVRIGSARELADLIGSLRPFEAIALGALRGKLSKVRVVTKSNLNGANHTIARDRSHIVYRKGKPAVVLLDFDQKGMPRGVAAKIWKLGGWRRSRSLDRFHFVGRVPQLPLSRALIYRLSRHSRAFAECVARLTPLAMLFVINGELCFACGA